METIRFLLLGKEKAWRFHIAYRASGKKESQAH
jgi:hypothetical protein